MNMIIRYPSAYTRTLQRYNRKRAGSESYLVGWVQSTAISAIIIKALVHLEQQMIDVRNVGISLKN